MISEYEKIFGGFTNSQVIQFIIISVKYVIYQISKRVKREDKRCEKKSTLKA